MNLKTLTHWTLLALTLLFLITGLGITNWQIVQPLTLGILSKSLSTKIHLNLIIPFLLVLILHIYFVLRRKTRKS